MAVSEPVLCKVKAGNAIAVLSNSMRRLRKLLRLVRLLGKLAPLLVLRSKKS